MAESAKIVIKRGWLVCPHCGWDHLQKINADTTAGNFPVYCRRCKREVLVNIVKPEPKSQS